MTRFLRHGALLLIVAMLAACGHGFEGQYQMKPANPLIAAISEGVGASLDTNVVIGRNFIDIDGERSEGKIFVRESGAERYLIFRDDNGKEDAMKIEDDRTLLMSAGINQLRLTRVE